MPESLRPATEALSFIKKTLWRSYFPVDFPKFLRTSFFIEHPPPPVTASEISATGRNFVTKGKIISSDVETGRNKPKQGDLPITRRGLAGLIFLYKTIKKLETPMQNVELEKTDFF